MICRNHSIDGSFGVTELVGSTLSADVDCWLSDGIVSVRTVVVVVVSPSLPIRLIVRYSVIVLPEGFGATNGGETGEARVINCLRSLSTVT